MYIISCEELLGLTTRQEETIVYICKKSEKNLDCQFMVQ